jgi:spore coat polysaccharide biosynthesis predicted glycosyltransferase SpsG
MSSNQNILIRADSSSTIGTGHIMRDLVLAKQYRGDASDIFNNFEKIKGIDTFKIEYSC